MSVVAADRAAAGAESDPGRTPTVLRVGGPGAFSRIAAVLMVLFVRPVIALFGRFPELRWPFGLVDRAAMALPRPRRVVRHAVALPHCRAELLTPAAAAGAGSAMLYLHGGGFIVCGLHTHRHLTADVARAAGCPALAVDYRQLGRHGLGEALEDAVDGFRALLDRGYSPDRISIVGDSAGGYLAVITALAVTRLGLGRPAALAVMSPMTCVDPEFSADGAAADPLLTAPVIRALSRKLAARPSTSDLPPPAPSLMTEDLASLPPTLIQTGTREILARGAQDLADHVAAAGVACELQLWEGQFHVFQAAAMLAMPPARTAVAEIGAFLRVRMDPR